MPRALVDWLTQAALDEHSAHELVAGCAERINAAGIPLALFFFNVGVEAGQLLFIAGVFVVWVVVKRINIRWPDWAWTVPAYGIGAVAAYWTIERVVGFWA